MCYACGSCISYVTLSADFLLGEGTGVLVLWAGEDSWLGGGSTGARAAVLYCVATFLMLPLSLFRTIEPLKWGSGLAGVATVICILLCVYQVTDKPKQAFTDDEAGTDVTVEWLGFSSSLFTALPIINVAFTAHYNAGRYYMELKDRSIQRFSVVCAGGLGLALFVYLIGE